MIFVQRSHAGAFGLQKVDCQSFVDVCEARVESRDDDQDVLRLLAADGTTAATLFPGYDGVVKSLRDRELWDSP